MATSFSTMSHPQYNHCVDPADIDSWLDLNALTSPTPTSADSKMRISRSTSALTSPTSTILGLDHSEDLQTPAKPSHEYEQFKQQTGIPTGSLANLSQPFQIGYQFDGFNSGISDVEFSGNSMYDGMGSGTGFGFGTMNIDMDLTSSSVLPAFFYPPGDAPGQQSTSIDPSAISTVPEPQVNIRVFPGMHQQQAAMAKAQAEAQQQRQRQVLQQQLQQNRQAQKQQPQRQRAAEQSSRNQHSRRPGSNQIIDQRTEETIARVVNQIRQNSTLSSSDDFSSSGGVMPHIVKMRKDEEDMDEDERLLASEEGKKLSSKERRQLRNKVSARAFRSRRKEYIGQLEGEVAAKVNECNELRTENRALMDENARSRAFIEKLLRHPAFHPFLDDLSRDPALMDSMPKAPTSAPTSTAPAPTSSRKDSSCYTVPEPEFLPAPQNDTPQVGMALIPEPQLDLSMLNLNNNWAMPNMGFNFQQPAVFSVLEVPEGPANPIDTDILSGKCPDSILPQISAADDCKEDYPVIERPAEMDDERKDDQATAEDVDEDDLYAEAPVRSSAPVAVETFEPIFGDVAPEKAFAHFELFISDEAESQQLMERFEKMCAHLEPAFQRVQSLTAHLDC